LVDGSVESPCRVLVKRNWTSFLSLTVEALEGKRCQLVKTRYQEGVGQFERRFQGEGVVPGEYFLVSTKLDIFCYRAIGQCKLHRATCRRFDTIPACDGQTDRQTELP